MFYSEITLSKKYIYVKFIDIIYMHVFLQANDNPWLSTIAQGHIRPQRLRCDNMATIFKKVERIRH